jgi:hypothetical protein
MPRSHNTISLFLNGTATIRQETDDYEPEKDTTLAFSTLQSASNEAGSTDLSTEFQSPTGRQMDYSEITRIGKKI